MNSVQLLAERLGAFRCGSCIFVIGVQNPIHSILLLMRTFFIGTLLLFFLQREYFARLFLIVYVGAIVVLFLFIMRRLELKRVHVSRRFRDLFSYRYLVLGFFMLEILFLLSQNFFDLQYFFSLTPGVIGEIKEIKEIGAMSGSTETFSFLKEANNFVDWSQILQRTDHLRALGGILYTEYKSAILMAAVLLFFARVGALAVAVSLSSDTQSKGRFSIKDISTIKRQDANFQVLRHPSLVVNSFRFLYFKYFFVKH